jgi:hypothetical protein
MSRQVRRAAVLATTLAVVLIGAHPGSAQSVDPTVTIDRTGTSEGEEMLITGNGWSAGGSVVVELCGHGGLRGSVDCDVTRQRTAGVGSSGTFAVQLTTGLPPVPCPCVVKATDQTSHVAATAPIAVAGMYTVPITDADQRPERTIEISDVEIRGGLGIAELFGAGGRRVLSVTLVNTGAVAVDAPDLSVAWGSGSSPSGFVEPPETQRMEPGDTQTVTIPLDTPTIAFGERTAVVEIQGLGEPVVARTSMSSYPWGLLVLALIALQLLLLRLRNRLRRRVQRGAAHLARVGRAAREEREVLALPPAAPDETAEEPAPQVIDLDAEEAHAPAVPIEVVVPDPMTDELAEIPVPDPAAEEPDGPASEPIPVTMDLSEDLGGGLELEGVDEAPVPDPAMEEPVDETGETTVVTLDLTEMERSVQAPEATEPVQVGAAANGSEPHADEAIAAAQRELQAAETEGAATVAAARSRLVDLETEAPSRMEEAEASCERELELLDAVWRRAEVLAKAAEAAVEAARHDIEADIDRARQALVAAEAEHASRVEDARQALARAEESAPRPPSADKPAAGVGDAAPPPAPRVDELDRRLARAVERALASMGPRSSN